MSRQFVAMRESIETVAVVRWLDRDCSAATGFAPFLCKICRDVRFYYLIVVETVFVKTHSDWSIGNIMAKNQP